MGQLIVIEGTDSSGKETQAKELTKRLNENGIEAVYETFPKYDTPTGRIIGGPYLGKPSICEGWFSEGAPNVEPIVASLYFAADRKYNIGVIKNHLNEGRTVILDRYTDSNMAHQGGKILNKKERHKMYKKLEKLEFNVLELIKPDFTIFLHLPSQYSKKSLEIRLEMPDQHEASLEHLINAEKAYLELAKMHDYITIECVNKEVRKTREELYDEVYSVAINKINEK